MHNTVLYRSIISPCVCTDQTMILSSYVLFRAWIALCGVYHTMYTIGPGPGLFKCTCIYGIIIPLYLYHSHMHTYTPYSNTAENG